MEKKLVSFSLADDIKSAVPAGYVESLEKLVNDIMIPRELEKMCTQEGRVYNYSFADYQKMARDIWGDTVYVHIGTRDYTYCMSSIGGFGHEGFGGVGSEQRLVAMVDGDVYQAQEQDLPWGLDEWPARLKRFANKDNPRLRWLVKNLLVQQPGYQELRKKMGLQPVHFGPKDEIKAIYNVQNGGYVDSSVQGVFASLVNEDPYFRESRQEQVKNLEAQLRELASLLCDGSVIMGDASKNWIYALCPGCRPFSLIGESYTKYSAYAVLTDRNTIRHYGFEPARVAREINNVVDYNRVANGVMASEPLVRPVPGAKIHSDVCDDVVTSTPEPCVRFPFLQNGNKTLIWAGVTCVSFAGFLMCVSLAKRCAEELVAEREKSHKKEIVIDRPDSVHNQRGDIEWHNVSNARNGHSR